MCTFKAGDVVSITADGRTFVRRIDCALDVPRLTTGTQEVVWCDDPDLMLVRKPGEQTWYTELGPHFMTPISLQLATA
ncbi:MAG: hypothetical protein V1685_06970 [Parcubacteria group bacterium]